MATDHNDDLLRNPEVDYDRTDLSPTGILLFLGGLLVAGIFIELVLWGMFRFLAHAPFFAEGRQNPMAISRPAGPPPPGVASQALQNSPQVNPSVFPEPRLQTDDVADMNKFLGSEKKVLYAEQPFADPSGAIHIPITEAMKLIEQRGLPVRPNTPAPEVDTQTEAVNMRVLEEQGRTQETGNNGPGEVRKHQ